jgi:pimeloyl-ACP methyl ester carboxylesterase
MSPTTTPPGQPTVVLVHGAFADGSSWSGVIERLQARGIDVVAPAVPLRGIATDSAYLADLLAEIPGPVIVAGHSYGGAVISNAATHAPNVAGLVFVAAFAPDEGERLGEVTATSRDAILMSALVPHQHSGGTTGDSLLEFSVDPAKFGEAFAVDLPAATVAVMAATQRPVADAAFSDVNGAPAWKRLPSWAVVATADKAAGTDITRSMAERAGATITEVDASHVVMVSRPQAVTDVILAAVDAVAAATVA